MKKVVEEKVEKTKKKSSFKKIRYPFLLLIAFVLGGSLVYVFVPKKKVVSLFPYETTNTYSLSCSTELGAVMFPQVNYEENALEKVEAEIVTEGSNIALEVDGDTLKFMTATSVEVGQMDPAEFAIFRNDEEVLVALHYEKAAGTRSISDTFVLNKKTGFGVWTKSSTSFFGNDMPDGQVYYLRCI